MTIQMDEIVINPYDSISIDSNESNTETAGIWEEKRKDRKQKYRHQIFWRSCMVHHFQLVLLFAVGVVIAVFTNNPEIRTVGASLISLVSGSILKDSRNDSFRILESNQDTNETEKNN